MTTKKEVEKNTDNGSKYKELILSVKDLRIWFKLRKFGFGNAGYVKAVDGVTFDLHKQE